MVHNQLFAGSFRKNKEEQTNGSFSITKMQALITLLRKRNVNLMVQPPCNPDLESSDCSIPVHLVPIQWLFYSGKSRINCEDNAFPHLKKRLLHSKCTFLGYLNQNGINALKIGWNACESVLTFAENMSKNSKFFFVEWLLFVNYY